MIGIRYHHAIAWYRAFRAHGFVVQLWRIHRGIGMGGDQLVASLIGKEADAEHGDGIRDAEKQAYMAVIGEVAPLERDLVDDWTTSADVEKTKPHPDLIVAALEKAGGDDAVMIGDSVWDCKAAKAAKVPTIALLTGGFSDKELEEAGAAAVFESIAELRRDLDSTPLG